MNGQAKSKYTTSIHIKITGSHALEDDTPDLPGGSEITINGLHKSTPVISNDYRMYIHHVQDFHFISQGNPKLHI